jgi:hypothetical protein
MMVTKNNTESIRTSEAIKFVVLICNHRTYNLPLSENWLHNLHSIYFFIFYIPQIFWGKPHFEIGIVNIDINVLHSLYSYLDVCAVTNICLYSYHDVSAVASICHDTREE